MTAWLSTNGRAGVWNKNRAAIRLERTAIHASLPVAIAQTVFHCPPRSLAHAGSQSKRWPARSIWEPDRAFLLGQYGYGRRAAYVDVLSPVFNAYAYQSTWHGQLSETHTLSPTAANQFLLAGTHIYEGGGVVNSVQTLAAFPTTLNWWNEGNTSGSVGGLD